MTKRAAAVAEAKETEEQGDLGSVSSGVLVGGQAPAFDLSFLPSLFEQEHVEPNAPQEKIAEVMWFQSTGVGESWACTSGSF